MAKKASVIVPLAGRGGCYPFYCVHSIGGEVTELLPLARALGKTQRVYGIQVPKSRLGTDFGSSVQSMAEHYVEALVNFQPQGPFFLGGWSAGSIIAFEMAQRLRRRGREVRLLVVLDVVLFNTGARIRVWHPIYFWKVLRNIPLWISDKITEGWGNRSLVYRIKQKWKRSLAPILFGTRDLVCGSGVEAFLNTSVLPSDQAAFARTVFDAVERYRPEAYEGRVLIVAARTQPLFSAGLVEASWKEVAARSETLYIDGAHVSMIRGAQVNALATHLSKRFSELGSAPCAPAEDPARGESQLRESASLPSCSG